MRSRQSIILIGLGATTATAVQALRDRFELLALVRPGNDDVVRTAKEAGVRVVTETSISAISSLICELQPSAVVVSSYNRILPESLLITTPFVNVHYAPLPRYRGRATVNWAILNGEAQTAISIHCLTNELDSGGILAQRFIPIGPSDTVSDLYQRLNLLQRELLADAVERRLSGDLGEPQDDTLASYTCARVPSDGMIDWSAPTVRIDRLIRSLGDPFPSAFTFLDGQLIEIISAQPVEFCRNYAGRVPGRVAAIDRSRGEVDVLTGDGILRLKRLQFEGAAVQDAATIITSTRMTLGSAVHAAAQQVVGSSAVRGLASNQLGHSLILANST